MGLKAWYDDHVTPHLIPFACGGDAIGERRQEVLALATGRVFELGCGGGTNFPFYPRDRVTALAGIDPHDGQIRRARMRAAELGLEADLHCAGGQAIPFADSSFDTAVSTYALCTVGDPALVLAELRRVLKPGGCLLFLEHGRAPDAGVAQWQERLDPVWSPMMGGCHLRRPIGSTLRGAGFSVEPMGQAYLPNVPRLLGWTEWGIARRAGV